MWVTCQMEGRAGRESPQQRGEWPGSCRKKGSQGVVLLPFFNMANRRGQLSGSHAPAEELSGLTDRLGCDCANVNVIHIVCRLKKAKHVAAPVYTDPHRCRRRKTGNRRIQHNGIFYIISDPIDADGASHDVPYGCAARRQAKACRQQPLPGGFGPG